MLAFQLVFLGYWGPAHVVQNESLRLKNSLERIQRRGWLAWAKKLASLCVKVKDNR